MGRLLLLAAPVVLLTACSTATKPNSEVAAAASSAATAQSSQIDAAWERETMLRADELMADAHRLQEEGRTDEALARADEALCELVSTPSGFRPQWMYLERLALLINEADELEAAMQPVEEDFDVVEELVILPPIDLVGEGERSAEIIAESPIPESDFPLVLNSTVESFLEAMCSQGEYHRRILTGIERAGTYLPMIREELARNDLPEDLSYLPLIESAFSLKAYSRARAHGMWQFISSTGRHYGLEVGSLVDERRDPVLATKAAAAYLGDLYGEFGDWYLALAAYNSGAGNVRRAIRRSGTTDFWSLRRYLPRETRNYVPAFIASVIVAKQPEKYGFPPIQEKPWNFDTIEVPDALDLEFMASKTDLTLDELRELNPAIRRDLTPARGTTILRLPPGSAAAAKAVLASTPRDEWAPRMIHTVRQGESLSTIAHRYGSSVSAIRQANGLRGSLIHPGQNLVVPRYAGGGPVHTQPLRTADNGTYTVQANDTLWDIAQSFSVSVDRLCAANGLSKRSVIRPGQQLALPEGSTPRPALQTASAAASRGSAVSGGTYTVRTGDTLYDIARSFNVSVSDLRRANDLSGSRIYPGKVLRIPKSTVVPVADRSVSAGSTYRVQHGDTLYDIARSFGVSVSELRRVNDLNGSRIYPGKVLRIPSPAVTSAPDRVSIEETTYRVRKGDTLYDIARRFGTTISSLRQANGLKNSRIFPGDVLRIPPSQAKG
jgi:membrane-bound lytic murein transglycosylase D